MMTLSVLEDLKSVMELFKAKSVISMTSSIKRSSISLVAHLLSKCVTSKLRFRKHVES
jgi:hypothetical protein